MSLAQKCLLTYLNKGIRLHTLCIFHCNLDSVFSSETGGVLSEMNGLQDGGEVPNVVEAGHQAVVAVLRGLLVYERHRPPHGRPGARSRDRAAPAGRRQDSASGPRGRVSTSPRRRGDAAATNAASRGLNPTSASVTVGSYGPLVFSKSRDT